MPQKLETVLKNVEEISNDVNRQLIKEYYRYLIVRDTGTNYQKDNIKLINLICQFR
jgi:hypothetical protein